MKSFVAVAIALVLLVGVVNAAEVPTSQGDKAMVFMFSGFDDLGLYGYPGDYGFGMRYYIADGTAVRGGLTFGTYSYTDTPDFEGAEDYEETASTWGLEAVLEKHLEAPCASVSPYWGVGAGFRSWSYEEKDPYGFYSSANETNESLTGIQVFGVMGFEWAFTGCMTLGGEYRLGFESLSGECEYTYETTRAYTEKCETKETMMGFGAASVFLSVYW